MPRNSILYKLIIIFIIIAVLPLGFVGYFISKNFEKTALKLIQKTEEMGNKNLLSAQNIGSIAIKDAVAQLDKKATEAIEIQTISLASQIAQFLYERDKDILNLSVHTPSSKLYLNFMNSNNRDIILFSEHDSTKKTIEPVKYENPDNRTNWHHNPPYLFKKTSIPLYREITFVGLNGKEIIKIKNNKISDDLQDISIKNNTYCRAEDYFQHIKKLNKNELYVSKMIGEYIQGWLYKDNNIIKVKPQSAYAGKENPMGKKFQGIIRWVVPVFDKNIKIGYLTMALDHTHIMEFTDHIIPTQERFADISDAGSGNYAFLWDYEHQNISHPRDFFICGYDPLTGNEVPGWLSQDTYNEYKKSSLALNDFIKTLPDFRQFSLEKTGSKEQINKGCVSLDCRILDHAPQCQGWYIGTQDGGSGSFLIFWSGLWKLTTYASVPYFTGQYKNSPRGFGYVTIGANVKDFHEASNITKANIKTSINRQKQDIDIVKTQTKELINKHFNRQNRQLYLILIVTAFIVTIIAIILSLTFIKPLRRLMEGAKAIGDGKFHQNIKFRSNDEIGQLGESFNLMAQDIAISNAKLMQEIDERLKTEQALKISEKKYRDIFESGVSGIYQTTLQGNLLNVNPKMASIFGYESSDSMIKEISDVGKQVYVDPLYRDKLIKKILQDDIVPDLEAQVYKKNREKIWALINARAVKNKNGDFKYIEGFVTDITKRKEAEFEKNKLQEQLIRSKKMESVGLLAGGVAHDLNNVLSGLVTYPDLILMDIPENSRLKNLILQIKDSGNMAAAIVQDLLALARRGVTNTEVLNFNILINEYFNSSAYKNLNYFHNNVFIKTLLEPDLFNIKGSAIHIKQIIMNLVSNAAESMPAGGDIIVSTRNQYIDKPVTGYDEIKEGDFVVFTIKDHGMGIKPEYLNKIFEPFYTKKIMGRSGTGLGMSVVWGVVQDHKGYIDIKSIMGKGTKFDLYFPATRQNIAEPEKIVLIENYTGNGESILIVDDIEKQRDITTTLLKKLNYSPKAISSGELAVEYIKNNSPDLVVLDMIMDPGIDGLETYKQIIKINPGQKAIIVSGFSEDEKVKEAQKLGAGKYVKKPYTLEKIGLAIKNELNVFTPK
ncbi:MAG: response regulator [Desulfobacula sp.]|nr:response regulator [Desulfobacula sp.]